MNGEYTGLFVTNFLEVWIFCAPQTTGHRVSWGPVCNLSIPIARGQITPPHVVSPVRHWAEANTTRSQRIAGQPGTHPIQDRRMGVTGLPGHTGFST